MAIPFSRAAIASVRVGEELRKARLVAGLTQEELAFRARVSRNYVSLLELGEKSPTVETLDQLGRALRVQPRELVRLIGQGRRRG